MFSICVLAKLASSFFSFLGWRLYKSKATESAQDDAGGDDQSPCSSSVNEGCENVEMKDSETNSINAALTAMNQSLIKMRKCSHDSCKET